MIPSSRPKPPTLLGCTSIRPNMQRCSAWMKKRRFRRWIATLRRSSWPSSLTSWPINPSDNLSAHKTSKVEEFLARHPNVHLHFTPTYSSWLNQVELWFAKIQREVIARGIFTSVKDLDKKIMRYIRQYNQKPKTVKWKYFDPTTRITCQSTVTAH